ncbi:hypothetical protein H4R33_007260, partial [Dimargaris cristalligena]
MSKSTHPPNSELSSAPPAILRPTVHRPQLGRATAPSGRPLFSPVPLNPQPAPGTHPQPQGRQAESDAQLFSWLYRSTPVPK